MQQILVDREELTLQYKEGFGAWTYYLRIPGTRDLPGKWGQMKVWGYIDDYKLSHHNLAPRTGEDKIISINQEIRDFINKSAGDTVLVTLYLSSEYLYDEQGQ